MGLIMTVLILLAGVISTVLGELFASEAKAWLPHLVERLVCRAVAKLPLDQQDRLAEEWRADLDGVPGNLGRLWVACGFQVAASEIVDGPISGRIRKQAGYIINASIAVILLVLCLPTMVLVSIAIKMESSGPILVSVRRKNAEGHEYRTTSFRTWEISVPKDEEVLDDFSSSHRRTTRFGKVLRRNSVCEIPRLFDAIKGTSVLASLISPDQRFKIIACLKRVSSWFR